VGTTYLTQYNELEQTHADARIVSLWDILMQQFPADEYVELARALGRTNDRALLGMPPSEDIIAALTEVYEAALPPCRALGFVSTTSGLERALETLRRPNLSMQKIKAANDEVHHRLYDDLKQRQFFVIADGKADLYTDRIPFGAKVAGAFPSAIYDIEEASKCLALGRGTACVFHLMRALELALRVLMVDMGEPFDPVKDNDWTKMLAKCNQHVGGAGRKQDFYRDSVTMLTTVKHSWRNPTMHPKNVYTEEEALDIWNSVRVFMRHLATDLSE